MKKGKLKVGIVGCGMIGFGLDRYDPGFITTHFSAYDDASDAGLVAVCDTDVEKAKEVAARDARIEVFADAEKMLSAHQLDLVSVCTPDQHHYDVVELAVKHGVKAIKSHLEELVGKVESVVCQYRGGIVTTGSHVADLLVYLFGNCTSLKGVCVGGVGEIRGELEFENGVQVSLHPIAGVSAMDFVITGTKGRLFTFNKLFGAYDYYYQGVQVDFFERALDDLVQSLRTGEEPASSGRTALDSLELVAALSYSAKNGGEQVMLPFKKDEFMIPEAGGDVAKWKR
jgi:predicted dehydrogenase